MKYIPNIVFLLTLGTIGLAQQPSARPVAPSSVDNANLPVQRIGVDDLLGISVYDEPELTRTVRVDAQGEIRLPMLKQRIKVSGQFPSDVEAALSTALKAENVLIDPIVTVSIVESRSRPINVSGAVRTPVTLQASGTLTLLDAIARAGGLSELAGPDILVIRSVPGVEGRAVQETRRISLRLLMGGTNPDLNLHLEGGEEIRVPEAQKVYVVGSIRKPGAFAVRDTSELSVMKALALSEGLTPYAMKTAYIYRQDGPDRKEIPVQLSKIMQRKAPDVPLVPNDIFYIPDNKTRSGFAAGLDKALMLSGALGAAAIYTVR